MKRTAAFILTAGLLCAALYYSYRRPEKAPEEPESVIWRMMDMSREGDVEGYLACFAGATRAQLETTAGGMTLPKFADYLRESVRRIKGVAVFDVQRPAEGRATLVVEYVYQEQNERQRMVLALDGGIWRIESAESSQRIQPLIPYGKPVTEMP